MLNGRVDKRRCVLCVVAARVRPADWRSHPTKSSSPRSGAAGSRSSLSATLPMFGCFQAGRPWKETPQGQPSPCTFSSPAWFEKPQVNASKHSKVELIKKKKKEIRKEIQRGIWKPSRNDPELHWQPNQKTSEGDQSGSRSAQLEASTDTSCLTTESHEMHHIGFVPYFIQRLVSTFFLFCFFFRIGLLVLESNI